MSFLAIITLAEAVITIQASKPLTFLNTRQFFDDLETAESRYKVVAKPVPYKPVKPAPAHFEGVTPTLPVVTKPHDFETRDEDGPTPTAALPLNIRDGSIRNSNSPTTKYSSQNNDGHSKQKFLPKVSLKEFLENKKKQKLLLEKEEEILAQVKKHSKGLPKTKYKTDTVIYPTTTYRPQTFHTSEIAKQLGINSYFNSSSRRDKKQHSKKEKNIKLSPSPRTHSSNRPSNYVEAANYKPDLAYGIRKSKVNKREKTTRRSRRLKKVRRKKKKNRNKKSRLGAKKSNREQKSFLLKQKELKYKYQQRNNKKNSSSSSFNKNKSKEDGRISNQNKNKYQSNWRSKHQEKKKSSYTDKNKKIQTPTKATTKRPHKEFRDNKFSSSLFLEDSTGVGGTYKSIRRATKPPKYYGYDAITQPTTSYAAPADYYGGITAYNALLSAFEPADVDYIDTPPPTLISPNLGIYKFFCNVPEYSVQ